MKISIKKLAIFALIFSFFHSHCIIAKALDEEEKITDTKSKAYEITMKQDILSLMMAYPEYITNVQRNDDDKIYIVMKSGKKLLYDDKKTKTFEEKIYNPDIQDMMEQIYPLTFCGELMDKNFDPGRFRAYPILTEVYGSSQAEVQSNLKNVKTGYGFSQFNKNNKAAEALQAAMEELTAVVQKNPRVAACAFPTNGTFNYRHIAGTNLLSPHAFGIAIDLVRDRRDYWKWATPEEGEKRIASYPKEIVDIFERNNFIWGGKWNHFDSLHFEYRPEIIMKARYFNNNSSIEKPWYEGVPIEEETVKMYIENIDKALN